MSKRGKNALIETSGRVNRFETLEEKERGGFSLSLSPIFFQAFCLPLFRGGAISAPGFRVGVILPPATPPCLRYPRLYSGVCEYSLLPLDGRQTICCAPLTGPAVRPPGISFIILPGHHRIVKISTARDSVPSRNPCRSFPIRSSVSSILIF